MQAWCAAACEEVTMMPIQQLTLPRSDERELLMRTGDIVQCRSNQTSDVWLTCKIEWLDQKKALVSIVNCSSAFVRRCWVPMHKSRLRSYSASKVLCDWFNAGCPKGDDDARRAAQVQDR
jgi:hypothetical protein